jgi:hypothetical protein
MTSRVPSRLCGRYSERLRVATPGSSRSPSKIAHELHRATKCHSEAEPKNLLFFHSKSRCFAGAQHEMCAVVQRGRVFIAAGERKLMNHFVVKGVVRICSSVGLRCDNRLSRVGVLQCVLFHQGVQIDHSEGAVFGIVAELS